MNHRWLTITFVLVSLVRAVMAGEAPSAISPVFSPDGTSVAFSLVISAGTDIAAVLSAGGKSRVLASFKGRAEVSQWFPDGKCLLVIGGGIWRVAMDGAKTQLAAGERARLSPDGKTLAVLAAGRLQLLDVASGRAVSAGATLGAGCRVGDWLDAETLVVLTGDGSIATIHRTTPETHRVLVPHKSMTHCFVTAAADVKRRFIAATSDDMQLADPNNPTSIWIFDSTGKQVGQPIPNATKPQWTATGQLFFARRTQIMLTDDFEGLRPLVKGETWAISPDGSLLIAGRRETGDALLNLLGPCKLYRIPIEAGKPRQPKALIE